MYIWKHINGLALLYLCRNLTPTVESNLNKMAGKQRKLYINVYNYTWLKCCVDMFETIYNFETNFKSVRVLFSRQIIKNCSFKFKELAYTITLEKSLKR